MRFFEYWEPAYEAIVEKLADKDETVRSLCSKILIQVGEPAISSLFETYKYSTEDLQNQIITVLFEIGEFVPPFLVKQLENPDNKSKTLARRMLIALGPLSVEDLVEILANGKTLPNNEIREILGEIGERAIDPLIDILQREENILLIEELLITIGARSVPKLVHAVRTRKIKTKKHLLDILVKLSPISIEPAIELLSCRETSQDGFYVLKEIGATALSSLLYTLEDANPRIRRSAPKVISAIGEPAFDFLLEKLIIDDPYLNSLSLYNIVKAWEMTGTYLDKVLRSGNSSDQDRILDAAKKLGTIIVKPIVNILIHSKGVETELLMKVLQEVGDLSVQELVLCMPFNESDTNVAIIDTISGFGERAIKPLLKVFPKLNSSQQQIALELLFRTGKCSVQPFLMLLYHSSPTQKVSY
ncbi:MAG: hypothetical protein IPO36_09710 [Anaerolineales bacterium]|nr:hypothetical protein [Anaerolineales bacterium]